MMLVTVLIGRQRNVVPKLSYLIMTDFEFINNTFVSMLKITKIGNVGKRSFVR